MVGIMTDNESLKYTAPLKMRAEITLSETQLHVLTEQARAEHRSIDQLIQVLLYEGWMSHIDDHYICVRHREPDSVKEYYSDPETVDLMLPLIPEKL